MSQAGQERFPARVHQELVLHGWAPGRNVADQVDRWLAALLEDPTLERAEEAERRARFRDHPALLAAARRVLDEFGGIVFDRYTPGQEVSIVPFLFHPSASLPNPLGFWQLEDLLGEQVFPVGVLDYSADLLVDRTGRVFVVGAADVYLGADIDEALIALLVGKAGLAAADVAPPDRTRGSE